MATETFSVGLVDDAGNPEPVIVPVSCKVVEVRESGAPTTDYFVRAPSITNAQYRRFAGSASIFRATGSRMFQPGETVGHLETVPGGGSVNFSGITDGEAGEA